MKNQSFLLLLILLLNGCVNKKMSCFETVTEYYEAFDDSNFDLVRTLIDDSLTIVDGPYTTTYSHESFHEQFKWDSIFQTSYEVVEIMSKSDDVIATVASRSLRFDFLKNNPLFCKYKVSFQSGKISKIEAISYVNADWKIWTKRVDSLVKWVNTNHPDLDGFIHDLSMEGAINYLKAIKLYESRNNTYSIDK